MAEVLLAWLGKADLRMALADGRDGLGPIAQAVEARGYRHVVLLDDHRDNVGEAYIAWLSKRGTQVERRRVKLSSPTHYGEIYEAARSGAVWARANFGTGAKLSYHLSPGTPSMTAVWILVAKTQLEGELIEASVEAGVRTADFPFELSAERLPSAAEREQHDLERIASGFRPDAPGFSDILHRSETMKRVLERAHHAAAYAVPVLLQGESGTGKELLAAALHASSPRASKPFVVVNCGALPRELVESELFGHEKGAFTSAAERHIGAFERADKGTLFLDEVGELSLEAQVKLLRALQEKKIHRVGGKSEITVDLRIVAATNRDLLREVAAGRFREDLFYRLAVLVLHLPPLRERQGDIGLLVDRFLDRLNREAGADRGQKKLSPAARNLLLRHLWPGNVRELEGTLWRAFVWARRPVIDVDDVREALFVAPTDPRKGVLDQPLGGGFSLEETIARVAQHYLRRALDDAAGNLTGAAELIGFKSYQRLKDWMKRYKVEA